MWIISILLLIIYWCWLFIMCKIFLSFSIDVYVIFFYWNIPMTNELHALHLHWTFTDVDIFLCVKGSRISILLLIIYWCWLVQNVFIILNWCLCDFLVLKHIHQWHTLHLHWSFTNVDKLSLKFFLAKFHLIDWLFISFLITHCT